jgi:hypothetical protein
MTAAPLIPILFFFAEYPVACGDEGARRTLRSLGETEFIGVRLRRNEVDTLRFGLLRPDLSGLRRLDRREKKVFHLKHYPDLLGFI